MDPAGPEPRRATSGIANLAFAEDDRPPSSPFAAPGRHLVSAETPLVAEDSAHPPANAAPPDANALADPTYSEEMAVGMYPIDRPAT